jgi:hypothetical protein
MRWSEHVARMEEMRNVYLQNSFQEKKPLETHTHKLKDNIKTDLRKTGCGFADWIQLA